MGMTDAQFKAFLREQLEKQKDIQKAAEDGDTEEVKVLIERMISRTQENIEDL